MNQDSSHEPEAGAGVSGAFPAKIDPQLVFIDARVKDCERLAAGVKPGREVFILDPARDGVEQITEAIALFRREKDVKAIHIVSHGKPNSVQLGSGWLTVENLESYGGQLRKWQKALAPEADILIYGCRVAAEIGSGWVADGTDGGNGWVTDVTNVADGGSGLAGNFLQRLSQLTGANIAASDSLTGSTEKGGDWNLRVRAGKVKAGLAFSPKATTEYAWVLANPTANNDSVAILQGQAVNIDVLANDTDADGDRIRVSSIISGPSNGTVAIEDDLYAGGNFTTAGGNSANYIAKWDGSSWSALGSGTNNNVYGVAIDSNGEIYAGGIFTTAGGVGANFIAKWDGSNWSALGSGMDSGVRNIATSGNDIYAGGGFTTAGGVAANRIAKWDGSNWSALSSGTSSTVFALTSNSSDLYAGGQFGTAGGVGANFIAKWNGSSWSALSSGTDFWVWALATSGTDLYVGGDFTTAGGVTANWIAKWDGSNWSALDSGTNSPVRAIATSGSDLYAGGQFTTASGVSANYIAKWNGSNWSALGSGTSGQVIAIAVGSNGEVYAGGDFTTAGGVSANYIAKWDGSSWSALGSSTNNLVNEIALDRGRSITYTPNPGFNGVDTFTYSITDDTGISSTDSTTVSVLVNNFPVIDSSGDSALGNINFNETNNKGTLVADIIASGAGGNPIADANTGAVEGIALSSADTSNGSWQYSLDNGSNWTTWAPTPFVSLLLAADSNSRIRFIPNPGFVGTVTNGITYHAWDQIRGVNGSTANVTGDLAVSGASSTFSSGTETASITVNPTIAIDDVTISEGNAGIANANFTVSLNAGSNETVTADYATADNTTVAGTDYIPAGNTLTFSPGEISKVVSVVINSDNIDEPDKSFFVNLSNPVNAAIADSQGIGTINDDDTAGITVSESGSSTDVTEGGATDAYSLVLNSEPTAPVTVTITADPQINATTSLVFDNSNWNIAQTVSVAAVDDAVAEGNHSSILRHSTSSADLNYNGIAIADVTANITDNNSAGVSISQTSGSTDLSEGSATDTYSVVLTTQPIAPVTINISTDGQTNARANAGGSLVFDSANWNVAQTVTVEAVDDAAIEGNHASTISHSATSADGNYNGIAINNITANIADNDAAGVAIAATGGSTEVTEGGATDTYTVALTAEPAATVTINFNTDSQLAEIAPLTFDNTNWNIAQTVAIAAADDTAVEGNHSSTIGHGVSSADANYNDIAVNNVLANIADNDAAGVAFTQTGGSAEVTEGGVTDTYTVALTTAPAATVTVSFNTDSQLVGIAPLTFDSTNWNIPQTVAVQAADDMAAEGNHSSTISPIATSTDANYDGIMLSAIAVNITDNDSAGVSISQSDGSTEVTEGGATDTYTIALTTAPTEPVLVRFNSDRQIQTIAPLTFTADNWNVPQTVTLQAADDPAAEGDHSSTIGHIVESEDVSYDGLGAGSVLAAITDNDVASVSISPAEVSDNNNNNTYNIVLNSQPTADVVLSLTTDGSSNVAPTLTFTPENWNASQAITPTAVDSTTPTSTISFASASADSNYDAIAIPSIVANLNVYPTEEPGGDPTENPSNPTGEPTENPSNPTGEPTENPSDPSSPPPSLPGKETLAVAPEVNPGVIILQPADSTELFEGAGTDLYKVVLASQPTSEVIITIATDSQITADFQSIVFSPLDWNRPQTLTLTAVDDNITEGLHTSTLTHTASSADANYDGIAIGSITANIADYENQAETTLSQKAILRFADSNEKVAGSPERDLLHGGNGNDSLDGGSGDDFLFGEGDSDILIGGEGADQIGGNEGTDYLTGNAGNDILSGGAGSDRILGGAGEDMLFGDRDSDHLFGDKGADTLLGGLGSDAFAIGSGTGGATLAEADTIMDFTKGEDSIHLIGSLIFSELNIVAGTGANAAHSIIRHGQTGEYLAIVQWVSPSNLDNSDFV